MIPRNRKAIIEANLDRQAAVAIIGPRQVGKTTLAIEIGKRRDSIYIDLESPEERDRLNDARLFFDSVSNHLVILDEIHRVPDVFSTLRGVIDRGRREGRGIGRFLMLGSGGFPDSFTAMTDAISLQWRQDFIRTYLEREVSSFVGSLPVETLSRLWMMLAHRQASLLNASELGRSLSISAQSVNRYLDLLVDLLLVRRLKPYHSNGSKRVVRSPKVYIRDSGIAHAMLGIQSLVDLTGHPILGSSWEGFVIENLISALPFNAKPFFYRTQGGAEIDLVVEFAVDEVWAIEIKRRAGKIERGFIEACADLNVTRRIIVHGGDDTFPMGHGAEAMSVTSAMQALTQFEPGAMFTN